MNISPSPMSALLMKTECRNVAESWIQFVYALRSFQTKPKWRTKQDWLYYIHLQYLRFSEPQQYENIQNTRGQIQCLYTVRYFRRLGVCMNSLLSTTQQSVTWIFPTATCLEAKPKEKESGWKLQLPPTKGGPRSVCFLLGKVGGGWTSTENSIYRLYIHSVNNFTDDFRAL